MDITKHSRLIGTVDVPGDKSISHRSIMLSALAKGTSTIKGFLKAEDCLSTMTCFKQMGIPILEEDQCIKVMGQGLTGLKQPFDILDTGNSGTTFRLLTGLLSGLDFTCSLTGDSSLQKRPMKRIITPLSKMGADIRGLHEASSTYPPLRVEGKALNGITYTSPVASAQVKSSILLAGLNANGNTKVIEPYKSRNHTELMLKAMGQELIEDENSVTLIPGSTLHPVELHVPGDISSAAYFLVGGSIVPNSELCIKNVGINPTRTGILDVLKAMGAHIKLENQRTMGGEPVADLIVSSADLVGTTIEGAVIPRLIDELPILAVAACFAKGQTVIKDASELKVKESNRIATMVNELGKMGAKLTETEDGMIIEGNAELHGASVESYHDHRVAMSLAVAGLMAEGTTHIENSECVNISYPEFFHTLKQISK